VEGIKARAKRWTTTSRFIMTTTSSFPSASVAALVPKLLGKQEVMSLLGVSDRTLEKLVRAGNFPPPVRLGKTARWAESIVATWLQQKVASQLAWQPRKRAGRQQPTA
jgi:prophage regulatory protein